jgi:three-Cys-motif partner protein
MAKSAERWESLCDSVKSPDGLPVRRVGAWTEDKLRFWNIYIDITTRAMKNKSAWGGLTYVDLFAGPGVCQLRGTGKRIPGSVLLAANAPVPFRKIIACEKTPNLANALKGRLDEHKALGRSHVLVGDCNEQIKQVVDLIPQRNLTLAFIDPTGLDAHFTTIETLTRSRRVDLLILFADSYDVARNVFTYASQVESKLDRVLGPDSDWRHELRQLSNPTRENIRVLFSEIYQRQLRIHLGYKYFEQRTMRWRHLPLYRLIFAARHELALKFWKEAIKEDPGGQMGLPFGV